jgi:DNA polymerase III sliding clamp (beta) subunit (PCNA family)
MTATTQTTTTTTVPALPHMLLLPPNMAHVGKCAAKDGARYAMTAVRLNAMPNGYRAEATNGRILARVDGVHKDAPEDYPTFPALAAAPNSGTSALVPLDSWADAFKLPAKRGHDRLKCVATIIGANEVTFGGTDLERCRTLNTRLVDGRWPDTDAVLPQDAPSATITLNADLLVELLRVASEFSPDGEGRVTLEVHAGNKPAVIRTSNGSQQFTGLIMPLS